MPDRLRKRASSLLWRGALMLVIGGGAFFTLESIESSFSPAPGVADFEPGEAPLAADAPALAGTTILDRRGDEYVSRAIAALANQPSLVASVTHEGRLAGSDTNLAGRYVQKGAGEGLRFSLRLEGQLVGQQARLLRVSDSRFLWTDLQWAPEDAAAEPAEEDRLIRRVDLRRVRREAEEQGDAAAGLVARRFGGLPMLLASLDREYDFAAPRRMQLDGVPVLAMVGQRGVAPATEPTSRPHHVVMAIEERSLVVRLVEYRAASDPLSASNLPPEERLRPSGAPLLRIRYSGVQSGVEIDDRSFVYAKPPVFRDETQRVLRLVRSSAQGGPVAALPDANADAARR